MNRSLVVLLTFAAAAPLVASGFDSSLPLKVYERQSPGIPDRFIGFTPSHNGEGLRTPGAGHWYVRPVGPLTDEMMTELAQEIRSGRISGVDFSNRWDVTNDHLNNLEGLPALRILLLSHTKITDQGLEHLKQLKNLEVLSLSPMTTDHGLAGLAALSQITDLDLQGTKVTDQGLTMLENFKHLERLALGHMVTDRGLPVMVALSSLRALDLHDTQITDRGLGSLVALRRLQWVSLGDGISSEGSLALVALSALQTIVLDGTVIPASAFGKLRDPMEAKSVPQPYTPTSGDHVVIAPIDPAQFAKKAASTKNDGPFAIASLKDVGHHGFGSSPSISDTDRLGDDVSAAGSAPKIESPQEPSADSSIGDLSVQISPASHHH